MIANKNSFYFYKLLADFTLLNLSFLLAAVLAQSFDVLIEKDFMFILAFILNITWYLTSGIVDLYDEFSSGQLFTDFINIVKLAALQSMLSVFFLFIVKENLFTRNFILYYFFILVTLILFRRTVFLLIVKYLKAHDLRVRKVLIIGAGEIGLNFYNTVIKYLDSYSLVGFLDDADYSVKDLSGIDKPGGKERGLLGSIDCLETVLSAQKIDDIVIALPNTQVDRIESLIRICNKHAIRTHIIPDYFRFVSKKFQVTMLNNFPVISVRKEPLAEYHWRLIKRIFDIVCSSLFLLLVATWLFPIIALIQKLTSKGPVFYIHDRIGMANRTFRCLKFRSLRVDKCNDRPGFTALRESDPRITRFGAFMRKTNIDELPQFINVFLGDMSIVGPRPAAVNFNEAYSEYIEELKLRNIVKPGITGWAQIHGLRGDAADKEENRIRIKKRFEFDLWYIENWSLQVDLRIIFTTVFQILRHTNTGT